MNKNEIDLSYLKQKLKMATNKKEKDKIKKQIELLEDSIVIYRLVRAPTLRKFTINVGDMPEREAMRLCKKVEKEVKKKKARKEF